MDRPGRVPELAAGKAPRGRKALLRLLVSALVLAAILWIVDLEQVGAGFAALGFWPWFLALLTFLGLHGLSALKWRFFLGLAGVAVPGPRILRAHAAGLFGNLCLPSLIGGDLLRVGIILNDAKKKRAQVLVGSVIDRLIDLSGLLLLAVGGFLAGGLAHIPGTPAWVERTLAIAGGLGAGIFLVLLALSGLSARCVRRLPRRLARKALEVLRALRLLRGQPVQALMGLSASLALQAGFVLVNVQLGSAVGLDLPLALWFLAWPLAKIAAMMPVSFGGLGVREAAFAAVLAPLGVAGTAVTQSLVWQGVLFAGGLLAGLFWMLGKSRARDQRSS